MRWSHRIHLKVRSARARKPIVLYHPDVNSLRKKSKTSRKKSTHRNSSDLMFSAHFSQPTGHVCTLDSNSTRATNSTHAQVTSPHKNSEGKIYSRDGSIFPAHQSEEIQDTQIQGIWHYWLDVDMDGMKRGWHLYDKSASSRMEGFIKNKGMQLSRTTLHLKSGFFPYEIDISSMTQRNMCTGTVRPIRRVFPNDTYSMAELSYEIHPRTLSMQSK